MVRRGAKPKSKVKIEWSPNFAYAIGLMLTDGCVSKDGRHLSFASKDYEQIENFMKCLGIQIMVGLNKSGIGTYSYRVQWSDIVFVDFLKSIGIMSAKSRILQEILIPDEYFIHFIRGCFDGDGGSYSYWDKRWRSSFMIYIAFASGSKIFIHWFQKKIFDLYGIQGHMTAKQSKNVCYQLRYSKHEAIKLANKMYEDNSCHLSRKRLKFIESLVTMDISIKEGKETLTK
jgi:hypothetical protein